MSVETELDDKTLRDRIAENPKPAALWLAGLAVLLVLELGSIAAAVLRVGEVTRLTIGGIASGPSWMAGVVADSLGPISATLAFAVTAVVLLSMAGVLVKWLFVPFSIVDRLDIELGTGKEDVLEATIVTGLVAVVVATLVATPLGAAVDAVVSVLSQAIESVSSLQTLTSRETIPNEGYQLPDGSWEGTWLGLSPAVAWAVRVVVVYAYAFVLLGWLWKGYTIFREHYREADWTPRDDSINRFRNHYWGLFGLVVVVAFIVMALWAPALGPTPAEADIYQPYEHELEYYDEGLEEVAAITYGEANLDTRSVGGDSNVGLMSYDQYDRFHPFGTNNDGKDLFTFLAHGAQVSLVIGLLATGLMAVFASALALITAYYKGLIDLITVVTSDSIMSLPRFLVVLLLSVLFMEAQHPIATIYDGGLLLALIFAATGWPHLWRAVRGPALQVAEQEWIDAAKSFGQSPVTTMKKHMAPYIAGYMLVYASMYLGGIIIGVAALSFLGFGVQPPTPEWGRAVYEGRPYVSTASWHTATIPGIMVVLVVTAFNALGDGIRDAIDPESDAEADASSGAAGGGG
ncbi:ABC transporter permease [Natronobacterium gregoryi]|uniref:ABC transporter permease n=2 Tax=Natronobacterium gregoryi TaxID=44930 RepID=L0AFS5_NATGS|nr:ABC transporter permease [Natronobacterium gregoryi]AFZ72656.1 ABC-type dipeptide/oligopeptide/nickel transport system, permease component [Natronobacterium gregoryi SP2]ELY69056.1 binding-protein-dependent transporters inner membrane component [Natronobacterium gregoryi SP2]PLK20608.1 ABC transporter permease [Natronobacterium gregoryi SP2]SFI90817.1 peptide/nickel transport system permease protein [Natronobacterium gregoryi]